MSWEMKGVFVGSPLRSMEWLHVVTQGLKSLRENSRIWEGRGAHRRSLHFATPDFLWDLVALLHFMRPSLRKDAHAAVSSAAWQEIRVRSGRDDNFVWER